MAVYSDMNNDTRAHDQTKSRGFLLAGWLCLTKIVADDNNQLTKQFPFKSIHYCCFWIFFLRLLPLVLFLLYRDVLRYLLLYDFKMSFLNISLS